MEEWEYWPCFLHADVNEAGVREYLKQRLPDWDPPQFAAQTLIPDLNKFGKKGWELVHMEPVARVGDNGDVLFPGDTRLWSNGYFCVFKRRVQK